MKTILFLILFSIGGIKPLLNAQAIMLWEQNYGGFNLDELNHVMNLSNSAYLITGMANSCSDDIGTCYGSEDAFLIKSDLNGDIIWTKNFGTNKAESFTCSTQDASGNFYSVGFTTGLGGMITNAYGLKDVWVVKTDASGNLIWQKTYGGSLDESAYSVVLAPDGSLIVACVTYSSNSMVSGHSAGTNRDIWILNLDPTDGTILWKKCFGGTGDDGLDVSSMNVSRKSVALTAGGDSTFVVAAYSNSISNDGDVWVFRIDIDGNLLDENHFGGSLIESAHSIIQTSGNGFLVTGASKSTDGDITNHHGSGNLHDGWILKLNANLDLEWEVSLGGTGYDFCYDAVEKNNGFYIVGLTESVDGDCVNNYGAWDIMVNYVGEFGHVWWTKNFGTNMVDEAKSVTLSPTGKIVVGGQVNAGNYNVSQNYGNQDLWVFEYSDISNVEGLSTDEKQISIFPNPSNGQFQISINEINHASEFTLEIFDLAGKKMDSFLIKESTTLIDASIWNNGCYIYKLIEREELLSTGKLMINH